MPELRELDPSVCERLLRLGTLGRVGLTTPDGPEIIPVNYVVRDDAVTIRTSPDGLLARYGAGAPIVFEVDEVDDARWHGWSVVAHGVGEVVIDSGDPRPGPLRARSWSDGDRSCELRLPWSSLTGRQVGVGWELEALVFSKRVAR
jgi:uncharacterized protein